MLSLSLYFSRIIRHTPEKIQAQILTKTTSFYLYIYFGQILKRLKPARFDASACPLPLNSLKMMWKTFSIYPCIQMSANEKRYDIFWFSFFHEIGHILLHGKKDIFLENIEYDSKEKEKELEADSFAANLLLPLSQEEEIIANNNFDESTILSFAKKFNTHPSIIVGRLQHRRYISKRQESNLLLSIELS